MKRLKTNILIPIVTLLIHITLSKLYSIIRFVIFKYFMEYFTLYFIMWFSNLYLTNIIVIDFSFIEFFFLF